MIHILIIVPYPELTEKICKILDMPKYKTTIDATIQLMTVDKVDQVVSSGYDLIIARGYTALTLTGTQPIPILPLPIIMHDILHAIRDCRDKLSPPPRKICCIGQPEDFHSLGSLTDLLNIPVHVITTNQYQDLDSCIEQAIQLGCDAIVGGYSAALAAQKYHLPNVFVRTGEEAIMRVLDEAIRIIQATTMRQLKNEMYRTVIHSALNGILYVDHQERIILENPQALILARAKTLKAKSLQQVLPSMHASYQKVRQTGKPLTDEIQKLYEQTISVDYIPIQVRKEVDGVLIFFQDITQIQKKETSIRKNLSNKGLYAKYSFHDVIHESLIMKETIEKARSYAATSSNIMLLGESGTGKELFAQSIHNCSSRKDGPFVAINCAALPENLLESELFGYVQGAFTGTNKDGKVGLFELAHGGTLFLDEISEVSINMQSKLLRVLQEREVRRLGDNKVISIDVRIICATNRNLKRLVSEGRFRQDLLYRLDVLRVFLPPLRQRGGDVLLIFLNMLQGYQPDFVSRPPSLTPDAQQLLLSSPFPGNVRELRNIAERVSVLHTFPDPITSQELAMALNPEDIDTEPLASDPVFPSPAQFFSENGEYQKIQQALRECGGNQTKAAKLLGMDRSTLWRKLKKYQQ